MPNIGCTLENDGRHMPQWHGVSGKEDKSQLQHWNYDISVQCLVSFKGSGQLLTAGATFRLLFRLFGWYIYKGLHDLRAKRWSRLVQCWIAQTFQLQPFPSISNQQADQLEWTEVQWWPHECVDLPTLFRTGDFATATMQLHQLGQLFLAASAARSPKQCMPYLISWSQIRFVYLMFNFPEGCRFKLGEKSILH